MIEIKTFSINAGYNRIRDFYIKLFLGFFQFNIKGK